MREMIKPMLCESITEEDLKTMKDFPSFKNRHQANIKFDGERIIAVKEKETLLLINRRGKIKNEFYAEVVEDLMKIDVDEFILDGEIISYNDNFNLLQRRALTQDRNKQEALRKEIPVKYMVFDILKIDKMDLTNHSLLYRTNFLKNMDYENLKSIGFVEYDDIEIMLEKAKEEHREGIIIKDMTSCYEQRRSDKWLKLKFFKQTELTLTTYTINNAGLRCEDKDLNAIQVSGEQHKEVKQMIDEVGYCEVIIQYLEQSEKTKRYRFPSFIKIKNG